jgi:mannose-6-phosphate isomerase-like protein (cupin superfamily)
VARIDKTGESQVYRHDRGWGYELWYENLPEYCGKRLVVLPGKKGSFHFHVNKLETMLLIAGVVKLRLVDPANGQEYFVELHPGDSIRIPRGQPHQIIAASSIPCEIIEFSTMHEEDDSHRIQKGD